jgi:hypothetical protein
MATTVKVTYSAQGSPDTKLTFDFTGIDLENIQTRDKNIRVFEKL